MTTVGFAHIFSCLILSVVVGVVYSINVQGWRQTEPLMHGIIRRVVKIIFLLIYLAVMVAFLTAADSHTGGTRLLYGGIGTLMGLLILIGMLFPGLVPDIGGTGDNNNVAEAAPKE